jgi:hypothetical protein
MREQSTPSSSCATAAPSTASTRSSDCASHHPVPAPLRLDRGQLRTAEKMLGSRLREQRASRRWRRRRRPTASLQCHLEEPELLTRTGTDSSSSKSFSSSHTRRSRVKRSISRVDRRHSRLAPERLTIYCRSRPAVPQLKRSAAQATVIDPVN